MQFPFKESQPPHCAGHLKKQNFFDWPSCTGRRKDGKTVEKKADGGKRETDRCDRCEQTARSPFELTSLVIEILYLAMRLARCLTQLD